MESLFCDQCHVYIQFHRICCWPHIEVVHLENDQVQARNFFGQRQTVYFDITLFHSRSNGDQCLYILLASEAQYLICSYNDCEGQYVANLLTGTNTNYRDVERVVKVDLYK